MSQWSAYSPDGGCALEFDPRVIGELAKRQGFELIKCVYDEKEQEKQVDNIVGRHLESFLRESNKATTTKVIDKLIEDVSWQTVGELTLISPTLKHSSFMEEQEYRLVSEWKSADGKAINCRKKENLVVPYYEFDLENDNIKFRIEEIMVGSGLPIRLAMGSISILFKRNNCRLGVISHTSILYRKGDMPNDTDRR